MRGQPILSQVQVEVGHCVAQTWLCFDKLIEIANCGLLQQF